MSRFFTSAQNKRFVKAMGAVLSQGDVEKGVESALNDALDTYLRRRFEGNGFSVKHTYPHHTDGLLTVELLSSGLFSEEGLLPEFSILVEAKRGLRLSGTTGNADRAKVLCQVLYYLRDFQVAGDPLPRVVVVADEDEIFALGTALFTPYLSKSDTWSGAPSQAYKENVALYEELQKDHNLTPYVETIRDGFDMGSFCARVIELAQRGEVNRLAVTTHTLEKAFLEFQRQVFGGQTVNATTQMRIFINSLRGNEDMYLHPNKDNVLVLGNKDSQGRTTSDHYPTKAGEVFNSAAYELYFTKYDRQNYTLAEQKAITEMADTLIEDFARRFTGDFWTPKVWVDEAHRTIERQLGESWREDYLVWDAACGAKNLTREYRFANLYCSTLHQDELSIAEDYNPESTSFQYDFLNDDVDNLVALRQDPTLDPRSLIWKMPQELLHQLIEKKPIVFFMNPPYGQATNSDETHKAGIAISKTGDLMKREGFGKASMEMYLQFIYRVQITREAFFYEKDLHFFFFNKGFLTSTAFNKFSTNLRREFSFREGFMMNAGEFSGTSSSWGIIFSGWSFSDTGTSSGEERFAVKKSMAASHGIEVVATGQEWKPDVMTPNEVISTILPRQCKGRISSGFPATKNGFASSSSLPRGKTTPTAIGYFHNNGSNVQYSEKFTGLYTMCFNAGNGVPVERGGIIPVAVTFAVRKSWWDIINSQNLLWVRDKDVFPAPTQEFMDSDEWEGFSRDCVVYSLFAKGSNQTALRDYVYGENPDGSPKKWRVENQFYWRSLADTVAMAQKLRLRDIEVDADRDKDRYVYSFLEEGEQSPEAQKLLEVANAIHEHSFQYRKDYHTLHPEHCLQAWDAGWEQVRRMCYAREALPAAKNDPHLQQLKRQFDEALKTLGDKIAYRYSEDTGF